ncbi:MAG: hypothetical protein F4229_05510 [Gammaproteobacteria bacterium]|nr:hypothetical protein [Gammaproteobacteria bacterium]
MKDQTKGVFCLEAGHWFGKKDRSSVEPMLRLLEGVKGWQIPYEHRTVATKPELEYWLKHYLSPTYKTHPLLYLAFHGGGANEWEESGIFLPEDKWVLLSELAEMIEGRCANRVIHLGSCSVMKTDKRRLNTFLKRTGALAVCGYQTDTDWMLSAAFDMLILTIVQGRSFRSRNSISKLNDQLKATAPGLYRDLGFRLVVQPEPD